MLGPTAMGTCSTPNSTGPQTTESDRRREKTFFAQLFGNIGRNRSKRLRLLCRIDSADHRRKMLALRKLERAKERKEKILSETLPARNIGELQWACRDIAAMLRREQFKIVFDHLKNGIPARKLRNMLFMEDGASTEAHRKWKIPVDRPQALPAILRFPKLRHRQQAAKRAFGRFPPLSTTLLEEKNWRHSQKKTEIRYKINWRDTKSAEMIEKQQKLHWTSYCS